MGAFKKFNTQDVYVSTYSANKSWIISGSQYGDLQVQNVPLEKKGEETYTVNDSHIQKGFNKRLSYESIKHLYYESFEDGVVSTTSSYDNYLQSSFNVSGSRHYNEVGSVYSLPKTVFGTALKPKSLRVAPESGSDNYVHQGYEINHIETTGSLYSSVSPFPLHPYFDPIIITTIRGHTETLIDDGEGNLYSEYYAGGTRTFDFSTNQYVTVEPNPYSKKVGNVIYPHGQVIITDEETAEYYSTYIDGELKLKSTHPIYTYNFHCKLKENEFTHTQNPSAISGSNGIVAENVAGKEFSPYLTTIGLYNDSNELIAIAKTGQPIPIPKDTDMTVVVKLDI